MRVVLAADQRLCRDALAAALCKNGVMVLAVAQTQHEVLAAVAEHEPDICLLSARGPAGSDLDTMRALRTRHPATKLVILADGSDSSALAAATENGAAAVVSRGLQIADLVALLECVRADERPRAGGPAFPPASIADPVAEPAGDSGLAHLTPREQEILKLMLEGKSTKEIARSLAITVHTVRTHAQSVLAKLGAHSRLEASGILVRRGLLGAAVGYPKRRISASNGAHR